MKATAVALVFVQLALSTAVPKQLDDKVSYDGYKAFRIKTDHNSAAIESELSRLHVVPLNLDTDSHIDVAVAPQDVATFEALKFATDVLHEDLGVDIAKEAVFAPYEVTAQAIPSLTWFNSYHAYADHVKFFSDLSAAFPQNSEIFDVGTSAQGRNIFGIHLWGSGGKGSKPAIYFHGSVHAREWITGKVVEYLTYQLLTQYGNNTEIKTALDKFDFYIIPFVNPDGFVYTQTNNRLWRKNRQSRSGASCIGTDMNRNWAHPRWSQSGGASTNPCDETYKGAAPGDTPEIKALTAFTKKLTDGKGIKLFIDWHSYGHYILIPYGYSCTAKATNHARQLSLAQGLSTVIAKSYGTRFTTGQACAALYATTGDSTDYLTDVAKAEFAWTIELRPGSSASNGFVLPAAQILPSSIEQWEGLKYLLANV